ncbi:hypothetical protein VN24_10460 [Paenibacillus beijingensis]|uniref:Uncharacterized protein n=1 Tax=Paenibacillus beijingensis TaxID=1126833 RepID=A0A0D5NJ28_9BACL|nr:hypothetical protein VN24_10460 [Paenibacillus beijingensis]
MYRACAYANNPYPAERPHEETFIVIHVIHRLPFAPRKAHYRSGSGGEARGSLPDFTDAKEE